MSNEEYEPDKLMDHEYDGIREYDNRLPNWWLYTLYGAIIYAFGYWLVFHTLDLVPLPVERYEMEMADAAETLLANLEGQELSNETLLLISSVPEKLEAGKVVFTQFCQVCHLEQGQGSVGPNLTDAYWVHGASPLEIYETVDKGVPEKGMAAWGGPLGPERVQNVVAYLLTLKNTNIAGKAPEGELVADPGTP